MFVIDVALQVSTCLVSRHSRPYDAAWHVLYGETWEKHEMKLLGSEFVQTVGEVRCEGRDRSRS